LNVGQRLTNHCIVAIADCGGALSVNVAQDIDSVLQIRQHRLAQCAVKISVYLRVFQKIAGFESRAKIRSRKKLIMFAVNFTAARRSRGAGDRIEKIDGLSERFDQRGLACTRWRGDDEENSVAAKLITQGFELAPGSFPVRLCRR